MELGWCGERGSMTCDEDNHWQHHQRYQQHKHTVSNIWCMWGGVGLCVDRRQDGAAQPALPRSPSSGGDADRQHPLGVATRTLQHDRCIGGWQVVSDGVGLVSKGILLVFTVASLCQ